MHEKVVNGLTLFLLAMAIVGIST